MNIYEYISRLSYVFFCHVFFRYQALNSLGGQSSQFSLYLSHQGNRGFSLSILKSLEIGGSGGATYLPYLVLASL